jgi:hypothetical protein
MQALLSGLVTYHWLYLLENASAVQEAYGESSDETTKGIPYHADLLDIMPILLEFFERLLNLVCDSFATCVDTIVREAASVALRHQDLELVFGESLAQGSANILQMFGITPQSGGCQCVVSGVPSLGALSVLAYP